MEERKTFDQIKVGDVARFSKTITESDIYLFAGITGDLNPVHINVEFARKTIFGRQVAHGMLTAGLISAVIGMKLPGPGTVYLGQTLKFCLPVFPGDTITAEVEVIEKIAAKNRLRLRTTCFNQEGKAVVEGEALVMVGKEVY
ncbi:MaoC family dehydratase [Desulfofundulus thermosubterraneus]|uniref:3-hydroxybutyryl-CoA dehydratase n=1 Tax=Desulfofundulus thermosubterraneus DSM 16057 TaxID=1121432 RepID=A0A1M6E801_9FIRM|nr:MaoC family dehydratase [Desulfofundulus thermosubterraneus]SHI81617.1 3-hydroxybutyryl-CoA dehydratase [Desulfofundulus thermosubterraneus DSM 16057]